MHLEQKKETFKLSWVCPKDGNRLPAGVAFFNEDQGDYRLKIDVLPEEKPVYLKVSSLSDGMVHYRVEIAVRKKGWISHRSEIGRGRAIVGSGYPIVMELGPFEKNLWLEPCQPTSNGKAAA